MAVFLFLFSFFSNASYQLVFFMLNLMQLIGVLLTFKPFLTLPWEQSNLGSVTSFVKHTVLVKNRKSYWMMILITKLVAKETVEINLYANMH